MKNNTLFDIEAYTVKQEPSGKKELNEFLVALRRENQEILAVVQRLDPAQTSLAKAPIPLLAEARQIWAKENPSKAVVHCPPPWQPSLIKKKPRKGWSEEAKHRNRIKRLIARGKKRYSFPTFWMDFVQEKLIVNPLYYGVCQISGSQCACQQYQVIATKRRFEEEQAIAK